MADTRNLMSLGDHYFFSPRPGEATPGFQTMERDSSFTWTAAARLSRDPSMQFTGGGQDTVQIEGKLYPHIFGGLKTLEAMRETGLAGKKLMLIKYYTLDDPDQYVGERIGTFVMTRLRRRDLKIGGDGMPISIEFSLELHKYGDDETTEEFLFTT